MNRAAHPTLISLVCALALALAGCGGPSNSSSERGGPVKEGTIAEVLQAHTEEILKIPGVVGTGEGSDNGERVFVIFVRARSPELDRQLPRLVGGYRVVVRVSGDVTAPPR